MSATSAETGRGAPSNVPITVAHAILDFVSPAEQPIDADDRWARYAHAAAQPIVKPAIGEPWQRAFKTMRDDAHLAAGPPVSALTRETAPRKLSRPSSPTSAAATGR
jgi:hypothetical protein